jgi:lipopolysaccharide transport system ATP-binding protein
MSSSIAISVCNLGKRYLIGHQGPREKYTALRDVLARNLRGWTRSLRDVASGRQIIQADEVEEFWALKDVSFEIKQGEAVGIIGRNGAGKSTLLKLLSRITEPTTGRIEINGRVASLLEVGTGFHPELTGRENIYLNGAILGMTRAEIKRKFDEIVDFAEIEKFLDTPVKRYSSGMYVRLAFAVAAHLDPEILVVDEVLAVGDVKFQKKCLGKMQDVAGAGRTVLFVSHNMAVVRSLCRQGILLHQGGLLMQGPIEEVIHRYTTMDAERGEQHTVSFAPKDTSLTVRMKSATLWCGGKPGTRLQMGEEFSVSVDFEADEPIEKPRLGVIIKMADGDRILYANNFFLPSPDFTPPVKHGTIRAEFGSVPFMAADFVVSLFICRDRHHQHVEKDVLRFTVEEYDLWSAGILPHAGQAALWWDVIYRFEYQ